MTPIRRLMVELASAAAGSGLICAIIVRPRIRRWGATEEEITKTLPGDELPRSTGYRPASTRAITIDAPPDEVWPWLVQMGSGRPASTLTNGSSDCYSSPTPTAIPATRIHPEWQELHLGNRVPYSRFNTVPVTMVDRPRCLIAGEWLVFEPLDGGTRTRLIARTQGGWLEPLARRVPVLWPLLWPIAALIDRGPGELFHHIASYPVPLDATVAGPGGAPPRRHVISPSKRIAGLVGPTLIAVTISETVISTSGRPTTPRPHIILYMRGRWPVGWCRRDRKDGWATRQR